MNNLIINEIDHSVFDLEWAKRGGVVKTSVCEQPAFAKCLGVKQDGRALFMFFMLECFWRVKDVIEPKKFSDIKFTWGNNDD